MSRNNDVFQVLATKGNQPILAKDGTLDALAVGQIGVFDYDTNLALNGTEDVRQFYLAVGVDANGDGVKDNVYFSSGQMIQRNLIRYYTYKQYQQSVPQILDISNFKVDCETEYAIRIEFRNQRIYRLQGPNQFSKTYNVVTGCCEKCDECGSGDCNELVKLFVDNINLDPQGLVKAEAVDEDGNVVTDIDAFIETNKAVNTDDDPTNDVCLKLRLTAQPLAIRQFCLINAGYYNPRDTIMITSLLEGFRCNGTIETFQEPQFEEGSGYDVYQREYEAGAWNGNPGPYRVSETTGLPIDLKQPYLTDKSVHYDTIVLTYDQLCVGGWQEYLNNLTTDIVIPTTDTTTLNQLVLVLNGLVEPIGLHPVAPPTPQP